MDARNPKMAKPGFLIQVTVILTIPCLVVPQSSSAPAVPALPPSILCIPRERDALLAFKAGLTDPDDNLSSWQGQDCCRWSGVQCSNRTGHVVELQINSPSNNHSQLTGTIGGEVCSSLLALRHLKQLDLSENNFGGRPIPEFIGAIRSLRYLDLSHSNFGGLIPPHLGNLSNLLSLSLDLSEGSPAMYSPDLDWLAHLGRLQFLSMAGVNLSNVIDWAHAVNMLPSLLNLRLDSCGLQNTIPPPLHVNLTSLEHLSLESNSFDSSRGAKNLFWDLPSLQTFYMTHCGIQGPIPDAVGNLTALQWLDTSWNHLSGEIPLGMRKLKNLKELWLKSNNLQGIVTEDHFANMSNLEALWLSDNSLTVLIENTWNIPLTSAGFSSCVLGPRFPAWLPSTLYTLDISNTSIHDIIPADFWITIYRAQVLDLSRNQLVGRLPTYFLFGGLEAVSLDISSNQLVGPIPQLPNNLVYLDLSGNNLSGTLPSDIGAPTLTILILFKNSISGTLPCSLLQLQQLEFLDLSENLLNGTLPDCLHGSKTSNITMLNLNSNNLSGTFPLFLQRSKELKFLDLANNKFSGSLPSWIGENLAYLSFLRLRSNMFSGGIPIQITRMKGLQYLDLACNNFTGNIPWSLGNMRAMALTPDNHSALFEIVNFGFAGVYTYTHVQTDSLLVVTKGQQLEFTRGIAYMVNIDLSCNSLTGQIPQEIGLLIALKNLNLSWNHLSSIIPSSIGELQVLESFDLSHNELSGEIPTSLSALTSLVRLNLSYNDLIGTIPSGDQLRTLDDQASIYIGNPGLCGPPLPKNCSGTDVAPGDSEEKEGMSDSVSFCLSLGIGCVVGLWTVFIAFLFKRKWKIICFSLTDQMYDWVYVQVAVSWAIMTRKMGISGDQN